MKLAALAIILAGFATAAPVLVERLDDDYDPHIPSCMLHPPSLCSKRDVVDVGERNVIENEERNVIENEKRNFVENEERDDDGYDPHIPTCMLHPPSLCSKRDNVPEENAV